MQKLRSLPRPTKPALARRLKAEFWISPGGKLKGTILDVPYTSILRWCGAAGFTAKQATALMLAVGGTDSQNTIVSQVNSGAQSATKGVKPGSDSVHHKPAPGFHGVAPLPSKVLREVKAVLAMVC